MLDARIADEDVEPAEHSQLADGATRLFDPMTVPVIRYRYQAAKIPTANEHNPGLTHRHGQVKSWMRGNT